MEPRVSWPALFDKARTEADNRNWQEPIGDTFYSDNFAVFGVRFYYPGEDHDSGGMKVKSLYYDGENGNLIGDEVPWQGTAADVFNQLQFRFTPGASPACQGASSYRSWASPWPCCRLPA